MRARIVATLSPLLRKREQAIGGRSVTALSVVVVSLSHMLVVSAAQFDNGYLVKILGL